MKMKNLYDVVIIGGGCTGFAGAMYAGRMEMKVLIIGDMFGGTIMLTDIVENYPGFNSIAGKELADNIRNHALQYDIDTKETLATKIERQNGIFRVYTEDGIFESKTIIFATGMKHKEMGVPGEKEFAGKGVHTCALCDGAFYKGKKIGVVGGSDSAAKEALLLTQWAKKVYMIYRKEKIRPEPVNMKRIEEKIKKDEIEIINSTNVKEIKGNKALTHVILDKLYKGSKDFHIDGLFVEIGAVPQSQLAVELGVKTNDKKEIIINRDAETNVPGVFAAGDVVDTKFKQAITGVGEAVMAVYSAYNYLKTRL